jgi:hypothetical protein
MKVLSALVLTLLFASGAAAVESNHIDDCHTYSPHGIWDCR